MKPPRLLITTTLLLALPAQAVRTNELVGSFKIAADLSRRSSQELAVKQAATIITTYIASSVDTDGDPFPEPPPFRTGAGPAGGGLVPLNLGAPITDGYGANLGYCAWDNGSVTVSTNRLPGSTSDTGAVTFAVVSAGLDGVFNRTCAQIASGAVTTDDDFVASYNTAQIRQGVGGTVYFGDPVADMTALGALTSTRDGELRLVKSDNTLWRWNTTGSNWTSASNTYTANNVIITGGTINGTSIGNVTPSSGAFTTLSASAGITGNLTGNVTGNLIGNITGNVTGNADTATRLASARTIGMTGDGNWSVAFDGSGNATGAMVLASTGVSPGSYGSNVSVPTFTVDAKGRLTAAANIAITPSLSSLTGAAAANTIGNGAYTQNWNWQLTGNTSAFSIGETAASTGGSGTQYLMNIGTLAGSTAAPLRVSARGVEAFRVDSVNPQIVANAGALSAPSYSFNGNQGTGFYVPATGQLAASVGGTRAMWLPSTGTNAALGLTALTSNTTGVANTAIGYGTLAANTTGVDNTGIGETALAANTNGTWNTAVGQNALTANVSGNSNVAIGQASMISNVSGTDNVAVGSRSLQNSTAGYENTAVGNYTLYASAGVSGGFRNTALGINALRKNTSGAENTSTGAFTLTENTSGGSNVANGAYALQKNTTGSNNTALGAFAGNTVTRNISGSNSTFVGYRANIAETPEMVSASNITLLGANATASGLGSSNLDARMTAIGAGASVTSINTVVLGRAADSTVIGATADDLSGYKLQVTGGIQSKIASSGTGLNLIQTLGGFGSYLDIGASTYPGATNSNAATIRFIDAGFWTDHITFRTKNIGAMANTDAERMRLTYDGKLLIGSATDDGSGSLLQVTGGIKALTGGLSVAGGDLVLGSGTVSGLLSARPAFGVANRIYIGTDTNTIYRDTGSAWVALGSAGAASLSSLTAATAANTIANGVNAQNWNWQLTGNTSAFSIGETAASTGGSGTQYLMNIGTLAASTAIPLSVSVRGVEAFRVDSVNPQLVANIGTVAAPGYAFAGQQSTGFYLPAAGELAASVNGVRSMRLTTGNTSFGSGALAVDSTPGNNNNAFGAGALAANTTGSQNQAFGNNALRVNTSGSKNIAVGGGSLLSNISGSSNVAIGDAALFFNTAGDNVAIGDSTLFSNLGGMNNAALGSAALYANTSGNNNTALGENAGYRDATFSIANANTTGSNNTFIGANAMSGSATQLNYATALGSGSLVSSANTIVLGRAADATVIGATADDLSGYKLQVTGGINALTGGLSVAGGDLVLGSGTVSGLLSARPAFGVANRIYIGTDTNTIYRDNGSAWVALGSAGAASLSSLTAATAANTIANGVNAQNWNWQLTGNTSAFSIGETAASTGGSGTQYLMNIGTLAASTAIPLSVSVRGVEAFRVDSVNPQLVANNGTVAAPGYAFAGQQSTGFYLPATGQLGASVAGTRSLWLTTGSASLGQGALLNDISANATAVGTNAMTANTSGIENSAFGFNALTSNTTGVKNTAAGFESLKFNTTGNENAAFGRQALLNNTMGNSNVGAGPNALLFNTIGNNNIAVGGGSLFSNVSGSSNVAVGNAALFFNAASDNIAMGDGTLFSNNSGAENVALGGNALRANTTGNGNVAVGRFAGFQDAGNGTTNANVGGNYNTFLGNRAMTGTTATINYATALGAAALVSSSNTVVLGRTSDVTVIGATADDVSGYNLQVTGGIKALTGGLSVAGGDLILGSGTVSGLLSARPAFGVANRIYVSTDTNEIYRDTGGAWNRIAAGAAGGILASADFANQGTSTKVLHGNAAGNPTWSAVSLTSDVSGVLPITSGGTGNSTVPVFGNIFMSDGSKLLPTALSFVNGTLGTSSNGTTATITFTNPQQLGTVNSPTFTNLTLSGVLKTPSGTVGAPSHTFSADLTTGLYRPAAGQLGASVSGTRSMWITAGSVSLGSGALASDSAPATNFNVAMGLNALNATTSGVNNTAVGYRTLALNVSGADNAAFGANALRLSTGGSNTGLGSGTLYSNTTGSFNTAVGRDALNQNVGGTYNTSVGNESMYNNTSGTYNVALGYTALRNNSTGSYNVASGYQAGFTTTNPITGSNSTFIGTNATIADTAQMASASNITLLGAGATASGLGSSSLNASMTAIGAGASVTSINTVVLGRAADSTVIGATADDLSGYKLQVTGGIKALTGGLSVAGGDLVLGSGTVSGLLSARPAFGTANRIYIGTDTNTIYRDTGSAWVALGSAGATSLSSLTAATAANTIDNAAYDQNWKWQLTGVASTGFSIGETVASTAGAGAQYLAKIGTLATSTAIPLSVSSQGTEAFRVNSTTPQILAAVGSATAPTYSFAGNSTTGFYSSSSALAASYGGVRSLLINSNTGLGQNALRDITTGGTNVSVGGLYKLTDGSSNTAVGNGALANSLSGGQNVAVGSLAGYTSSDYSGSSSIFIGASAIPNTTRLSTAGRITLIGSDTSASLSSNPSATNVYMTALGSLASVTSENTIVLGRAGSDSIVIGATGVATSGNASGKTLQVTGTVGVTGALVALSVTQSSDARLKENIVVVDRSDTLQRLKMLNGYHYNFIEDPKKTPTYGVIAQEILNLFPDTVRTRDDGFYGVDYSALSALTASAVGQLATNMDKYGLPSNGNTAANGALLIGNGKGYTSSTLTAGAGIGIVNDAGNITINNTGVTGFNGRTGNVILGLDDVNGVTSFGNGNVTLGKGALAATATGAFNTASGQGALASTNNGSGNSAQGYQALFGNTTGTNNTGLGRQAGYANRAGSSANANLGGSNNTFIGANTLPGTAQQLNYATAIGSDAIVTTSGTIVLGRNNDVTVLGAAGDDRSGNRLQVTGGIKATGNLTAQALSLSTGTNTKAGLWIENGAAAGAGNGLVQTDDSTLLFSKGQIDGAAALVIAPWANGSSGLRIAASGVSVAGSLAVNGTVSGTSAFAVSSDIRYKKNITPVINALATIEALQGVHYEFDRAAFPKKGFEAGRQLGFIAQQIEQFVPEVVRTDTEGYKSVQYSQLVPLLAEGIKAQQLILKHLALKDPATLLVDIKTFQGNDAVFENIKATNIKTANLEADTARIKKLEADRIETKYLRSDVMKTGETEVFVSLGSFQPIFVPLADAQYIVNATADDGSSAFASVAFMAGKITVTPISGKGVDVTTMGSQVGLVAASKKIKATWIRMS